MKKFILTVTAPLLFHSLSAQEKHLTDTTRQLGEIQIVGSRSADRTKLNSPVPVDIIDIKTLQESAPQTSITQLLQYISPSFTQSTAAMPATPVPRLTSHSCAGWA